MAKKKTAKKATAPKKAAAKKPSRKPQPPTVTFPYIHDPLRQFAEPIDSLTLNPNNAVKHDDQSIKGIAASLDKYGQRGLIVVNELGRVVLKGNGTLQAAQRLGWTHLAVLWVKDDPATATGYAIADNRAAQFAEWDNDILAELLGTVHADDAQLFDDLLLADLCEGAASSLIATADPADPHSAGDAAASDNLPAEVAVVSSYQVVVECRDEDHQKEIYEGLTEAGHNCKCLTI